MLAMVSEFARSTRQVSFRRSPESAVTATPVTADRRPQRRFTAPPPSSLTLQATCISLPPTKYDALGRMEPSRLSPAVVVPHSGTVVPRPQPAFQVPSTAWQSTPPARFIFPMPGTVGSGKCLPKGSLRSSQGPARRAIPAMAVWLRRLRSVRLSGWSSIRRATSISPITEPAGSGRFRRVASSRHLPEPVRRGRWRWRPCRRGPTPIPLGTGDRCGR